MEGNITFKYQPLLDEVKVTDITKVESPSDLLIGETHPYFSEMPFNEFPRRISLPGADDDFMKFDEDKVMMSLVDPDFITGVADILTFGAKKYAKNNWQKNTDIDRYKDSTLRHLYAYLGGELIDEDSGRPHLDHVATNIMFLRHFEHGKGSDNVSN